MRYVFLLLLALLPAPAFAQAAIGVPLYPMLLVDEGQLGGQFERAPYPAAPWADAKACLIEMGYKIPARLTPPELVVIPAGINSIRVGDITRDSLFPDVTHFTAPTIAYALVRSHKVLILAPARASFRVLRHEALHELLWWSAREYGHPANVFYRCDLARGVPAQ